MPYEKPTAIDPDSKPFQYYRTEVLRHWDPSEIDLSEDRQNLMDAEFLQAQGALDALKDPLARFGAGEQSVTEDLAPLATALDDINDQMFVTTQLYEESKHAEFFHRYWTEVINPVEEEFGHEITSPYEDRWFGSDYVELFDRNEEAMHRLLEDDSPEALANAYCHYHMTIEGMLAESGYYGLQSIFGTDKVSPVTPELPGLDEGLNYIRGDEGRHVGFGALKLRELTVDGPVDMAEIEDTLEELLELVVGGLHNDDARETDEFDVSQQLNLDAVIDLSGYARDQYDDRLKQIQDAGFESGMKGDRPAAGSD
jgi:ribonucleoside-diphosphate reductase beta chain